MARRKTDIKGIYFENGFYTIDKVYRRIRIYQRTGLSDKRQAEKILEDEKRDIDQAILHGINKQRTLADAFLKYFAEATHKSIQTDIDSVSHFEKVPAVLELPLDKIHDATLKPYVEYRQKKDKVRNSTIKRELQIVVRVLNKASRVWRDELTAKPWLQSAPPLITMPKDSAKTPKELKTKKIYPLSWAEQSKFFSLLPGQLQRMALVAVNTGKRDKEICGMRWQDERYLKDLKRSVFVVWDDRSKNGEPTVLIPNSIAMAAIEEQRGEHHTWVWPSTTGQDCPVYKMRSRAWVTAWQKAKLPKVDEYRIGPHNLRHTCGRRLRAAGVNAETRKDILGHKNKDITTHYSMAEFKELFDAVELITERNDGIILRSVKAV